MDSFRNILTPGLYCPERAVPQSGPREEVSTGARRTDHRPLEKMGEFIGIADAPTSPHLGLSSPHSSHARQNCAGGAIPGGGGDFKRISFHLSRERATYRRSGLGIVDTRAQYQRRVPVPPEDRTSARRSPWPPACSARSPGLLALRSPQSVSR